MELFQRTGLLFAEGLDTSVDLPHTISHAILYRARIDSMHELPEDKQPPRGLWDKPYAMKQFMKDVFNKANDKSTSYVDYEPDNIE